MRTTVTLDSEADALVRRLMAERGLTFKQAVNEAIVAGLAPRGARPAYSTPTFDLGVARVNLDRAVALAADIEDEHLLQKRDLGK